MLVWQERNAAFRETVTHGRAQLRPSVPLSLDLFPLVDQHFFPPQPQAVEVCPHRLPVVAESPFAISVVAIIRSHTTHTFPLPHRTATDREPSDSAPRSRRSRIDSRRSTADAPEIPYARIAQAAAEGDMTIGRGNTPARFGKNLGRLDHQESRHVISPIR